MSIIDWLFRKQKEQKPIVTKAEVVKNGGQVFSLDIRFRME